MSDDDENSDRCPECHEYSEHCDCEPAIVAALEDDVYHACRKAIRWGDLIQLWDEGVAHLECEVARG